MFREMDGIHAERVRIPDAQETFWHCRNVRLRDVELANADYLFMHSSDIDIRKYRQDGNYSFQYCRNVEIHDAVINSKDAFWNTENVTVYDSRAERRVSRLALARPTSCTLPHIGHTAPVLATRTALCSRTVPSPKTAI